MIPALVREFLERRGEATRMAVRLNVATVLYLELVPGSGVPCGSGDPSCPCCAGDPYVMVCLEAEYAARGGTPWARETPWPRDN